MYEQIDLVSDEGDTPAVVPNTDMMAREMGYTGVEKTRVHTLSVMDNGTDTFLDQAGPNKFRSCIFAEFEVWLDNQDIQRKRGGVDGIVIDLALQARLVQVMGKQVCDRAMESEGTEHPFVYAVMTASTNGNSTIYVEWK